ncbi:ABC transporter substrate-binding protein [Cellulomonas timonensis]|uniref:ABC transporter substrate-binding protein n=1 Tax=Cellulomonas timonensis TaxID=1689271 RepID=UPI000834AB70|nr:extracellular solute-binding protein [Cellulomonas timonensis]
MRKTWVAVMATACLALSACGSGDGGSTAVKDTVADKGLPIVGETVKYDPNTLVNDGEPINLEWWMWDGDETFGQFAEAYEEIHPNVDIQIVNQPWDDYWTKLPLQLQSDDGPALYNVHNSHHENLITYMEPYDIPVDELAADYAGVEAHVIDGKVYYIDFGMMTGLIFYNTAMWEAAGLTDADIPETWDEFRDVAKKLTIRDGNSFTQAGFNFNSQFKEFSLGLPYQQGQHLMAADQATPDLDNQAMLDTINLFTGFYDVDQVGSKDFGPVAADSFGQGQTAMIYNWGHFGGTLGTNFPEIEYGTFRTPVPEAGVEPYAHDRYNGESTLGINAKASDAQKAVAQDFLRFYLTNADLMKDLSLHYSVFPMYQPLADDPDVLAHPVLSALGDITKYVWPGPIPATFETSIDTMWQDILYNGVAPETALATAQKTVETDLSSTDFVGVENLYAGYSSK